jgi:predicted AlkP superfamily phosphohydrolase/phosphomutase
MDAVDTRQRAYIQAGIFNTRISPFHFLIALFVFALAPAQRAEAYIGPGAGFAVAGSLLVMVTALLSGLLAIFSWPIRWVFRAIRGRRAYAKSRIKRFVVLGLDGLDPGKVEQLMAAGKLPNLAGLRQQGCFKRLATTVPPISPVAWSSFQTACNPGKHNIYDFLSVSPQSYLPRLSSVDIHPASRKITLGRYQFPLGKAGIRLLRKGKPFWQILGEHDVFSNVLRVPITFPPERFYGVLLSGMCVPDLRGTQGTFSFYTTGPSTPGHISGQSYHVTRQNARIEAELIGPENPFRIDGAVLKCPFTVTITDNQARAQLRVNGRTYKLSRKVYSDWVRVDFRALPWVKLRGICRMLLLSTEPEFQLYVTPINIDPEKPAMTLSHPAVYATYLAKRQGPFATLGLAEDSWALNEKILRDEDFIEQCIRGDVEREKMFFDALDKLRRGFCVCVFDGTDRIQHTFWRYIDPQSPADKPQDSPWRDAIEQVYRRADALVGKTMAKCNDTHTVLMVISDHGFGPFRYGVDLNRWLQENGFLAVKPGGANEKYLQGIDWSGTRAFAVGLAGIYLNVKGRYAQGIVEPGKEAEQLAAQLAAKLTGLKDPATGEAAIRTVYPAGQVYRGPYTEAAPDLIVGYNRGYRASWDTAVGQVTEKVFCANTRPWSGDHCIDALLVPGTLFCNRPISTEQPRLIDIGPTVLDMFGIAVPPYMDGRPLAVADPAATKHNRNRTTARKNK